MKVFKIGWRKIIIDMTEHKWSQNKFIELMEGLSQVFPKHKILLITEAKG